MKSILALYLLQPTYLARTLVQIYNIKIQNDTYMVLFHVNETNNIDGYLILLDLYPK